MWYFDISREARGVLKRSFSLMCPCDAFSERAHQAHRRMRVDSGAVDASPVNTSSSCASALLSTGNIREPIFTIILNHGKYQRAEFINAFDFGKNTAQVFDDMLNRSVPFYAEIQRMMAEMAGLSGEWV